MACVRPVFIDVVADGQQVAPLVEEKVVLHACELAGLRREALDGCHPVTGMSASGCDLALQIGQPVPLCGRCPRSEAARDACAQIGRKRFRQSAQGRDGNGVGEIGNKCFEPARCRRHQQARGEEA
ncbi:MAG: hypothetical protein AW07_03754 [Candidatus Accumulibacter sp. SK-11]|nr:MAG: hypothetical protein AW07_03754 [Candidatus Accumulibacter sp. SK-11]